MKKIFPLLFCGFLICPPKFQKSQRLSPAHQEFVRKSLFINALNLEESHVLRERRCLSYEGVTAGSLRKIEISHNLAGKDAEVLSEKSPFAELN